MNTKHILKSNNLYKLSNYWLYHSSQSENEYLPPELKYLSEFEISEISRIINLEKVVVYCLGIVFLRVILLIEDEEYKKMQQD